MRDTRDSKHWDFQWDLLEIAPSSRFPWQMQFSYKFSYGLAPGPLVYLYVADILPDIGVGLLMSLMWIFDVGVSFGFPIILRVFNIETAFIVFIIGSFCGLLFMIFVKI